MPRGTGIPPRDIVPGTEPLSTGEVTEFTGLVFRNWELKEELEAEYDHVVSASGQLAYVRWLRDVRLP